MDFFALSMALAGNVVRPHAWFFADIRHTDPCVKAPAVVAEAFSLEFYKKEGALRLGSSNTIS